MKDMPSSTGDEEHVSQASCRINRTPAHLSPSWGREHTACPTPPRTDSSTRCTLSACPPEDGCTHTPHSNAPSTDLGRHQFLLFVLKRKTWFHDNCTVIPISSTLPWKPASFKVSIPTSMSNFQGIVSIQPALSTDHIFVISS